MSNIYNKNLLNINNYEILEGTYIETKNRSGIVQSTNSVNELLIIPVIEGEVYELSTFLPHAYAILDANLNYLDAEYNKNISVSNISTFQITIPNLAEYLYINISSSITNMQLFKLYKYELMSTDINENINSFVYNFNQDYLDTANDIDNINTVLNNRINDLESFESTHTLNSSYILEHLLLGYIKTKNYANGGRYYNDLLSNAESGTKNGHLKIELAGISKLDILSNQPQYAVIFDSNDYATRFFNVNTEDENDDYINVLLTVIPENEESYICINFANSLVNHMSAETLNSYSVTLYSNTNIKNAILTNSANITNLQDQINNLDIDIDSKILNGKKIEFIGDSITYGVGASDRGTTAYVPLIHSLSGAICTNFAKSGATMADNSVDRGFFSSQVSKITANADIIVIAGCTNDYWCKVPLGTIDSSDQTTFCGALNNFLEYIITTFQHRILFIATFQQYFKFLNTSESNHSSFITNGYGSLEDYVNAAISICNKYSVPVLNLHTESNMPIAINSAAKTYYTADGVHPNDNGHLRIAELVIKKIYSLL